MPDLRAARIEDIPRLIEIRAAVRENRLVSVTIGPDDYGPYIADARCWVMVRADGAVQAFAALDAATASVWALFVDPAYEGRGLGRVLLDRLVAEARRRGLTALRLETAAGTRAERFYLRAGWKTASRDSKGVLRMTLSL
jgi:GNAT superfamily N-acetyltransferase